MRNEWFSTSGYLRADIFSTICGVEKILCYISIVIVISISEL